MTIDNLEKSLISVKHLQKKYLLTHTSLYNIMILKGIYIRERGSKMGFYLNPGNDGFLESICSRISGNTSILVRTSAAIFLRS